MSICRVCLLTNSVLMPIDEMFVNNYNLLTNLNVKLGDELPQSCCHKCADDVQFYINFREKCITSEATLNGVKTEFEANVSGNCNFEVSYEEGSYSDDVHENIVKKEEDIKVTPESMPAIKIKINNGTKTIKPKTSKKSNKDTFFNCGICVTKFKDKVTLQRHLTNHQANKECEVCNEAFSTWPQLYSHRIIHLPAVQQTCHLCGKRYRSPNGLEYHYLHEHNDELEKKLRCKLCPGTFKTLKQFKYHRFYFHSDKKFPCDRCSKRFSTQSGLKNHAEKHETILKYICDTCGYSTKYKSNLKDHIQRHAPEKVICKKCEKVFSTKQQYSKHVCREKTFVCPYCGLQFNKTSKLQRHLETHKDIGRHKCDRCPKIYKSRQALRVHLNRHDGVRPCKCEFCPATFFSAYVLIKHRRTHTGERPYVCKICKKGFMANHNLKMHMRTHGQYLIVKKNKEDEPKPV